MLTAKTRMANLRRDTSAGLTYNSRQFCERTVQHRMSNG
jgi:hypothetical protein